MKPGRRVVIFDSSVRFKMARFFASIYKEQDYSRGQDVGHAESKAMTGFTLQRWQALHVFGIHV